MKDYALERLVEDQWLVECSSGGIFWIAQRTRRIALGIAVNYERSFLRYRERSAQIYGRRSLSDAAFLV